MKRSQPVFPCFEHYPKLSLSALSAFGELQCVVVTLLVRALSVLRDEVRLDTACPCNVVDGFQVAQLGCCHLEFAIKGGNGGMDDVRS
jgi:hypothetical protein